MNIFQALKLAFKKIKFSKGKSLFVIIPISLMVGIIVLASSEGKNLIDVAKKSIFSPIAEQNQVIELNKNTSFNPRRALENTSDTGYTSTDNILISTIANVEKTSLVTELPLENVKTDNVFEGKTIFLSSFVGLSQEYAKLYTTNSFEYKVGEAIPIILNANDFYEIYQDWQGKNEISVDFTQSAGPIDSNALTAQSPEKTRALSYDRNSLIGKEISISIGGLKDIQTIKQESSTTGYKYTLKTDAEIAAEKAAEQTAISKYWDYTKISTPITYKFVIAGISEGTDKTKTYIPEAFSKVLFQDFLNNEIAARNGTAIPSSEQNATYLGMVYDGVTIQNDTTSSIYAGLRNQINSQVSQQIDSVNKQIDTQNSQINNANQANRNYQDQFRQRAEGSTGEGPGGGFRAIGMPQRISINSVSKLNASNIKVTYPGAATTYTIPGLVYTKDRTTNEVTGLLTTFDFSNTLPIASNTILIKINDIANREGVVSGLNTKGYNFQDFSQYKQYQRLEGYLNVALQIGSIVFMAVTALFILINMAKFVSEGRREIGIFRAIGASKSDISLIFILQSLTFVFMSIVIGTLVGMASVWALSTVMVDSAQKFINAAVGSTVTLSGNIASSDFLNFDYSTILLYAAGLLVVTLIVSLIPSSQAAKVSPVEAIRN